MIVDVKAVKGRVAFTAARGGTLIPTDRYIPVALSPWLERLESVQGDIEIRKPEKKPKASHSTAPAKSADAELKLEQKDEK